MFLNNFLSPSVKLILFLTHTKKTASNPVLVKTKWRALEYTLNATKKFLKNSLRVDQNKEELFSLIATDKYQKRMEKMNVDLEKS